MGRGEGGHVGGVTSEASDSDVKAMLREVYLIIKKGPPMLPQRYPCVDLTLPNRIC